MKSQIQVANYISNGSFEELYSCSSQPLSTALKYWGSIDSTVNGEVIHACWGNMPLSSAGFQYPKSGLAYARLTLWCPYCVSNSLWDRSNFRNRLKEMLVAGKTYCVKMWVTTQDICPVAIDGFGFYFGGTSVDTIIYNSKRPLTFLSPQVVNPTNNIILDSLNWVPITGTFTASGNEKYLIIGNFKSDVNTNTVITNYTSYQEWSEYFIDDVSCIPIDLPAYAYSSNNAYAIPGNTLYLGRQQDVGIDEACMWYKLPNTTTAIDTAAGITITVAATTETYMVKQDICGVIKYDTVVVHPSGAGVSENTLDWVKCKLVPNPANDQVEVTIDNADVRKSISRIIVLNSLGHKVYENSYYESDHISLNVSELPDGFYFIRLQLDEGNAFTRKLMISR